MGACLSCIGVGRHEEDMEPSETERLLYEDEVLDHRGYGSAARGSRFPARDPEELRRQREMLESICIQAANNLIDVHDTALLTLRGKPSDEFAALLNSHFGPVRTQVPSSSTDQDPTSSSTDNDHSDPTPLSSAPQTPDLNRMVSSPPEPPSPFTQAQMAAHSSQNGTKKHHHSLSVGLSQASHAHSTTAPSTLARTNRDFPPYARQLDYGAAGTLTPPSKPRDSPRQATSAAENMDEDDESRREVAWLAEAARYAGSTDPADIRVDAAQSLVIDLGPSITNEDGYDDDDDYSDSERDDGVHDEDAEHAVNGEHEGDDRGPSQRHPFSRAESGMDHRGQGGPADDEQEDHDDERGYEFVSRTSHTVDDGIRD